MAEVKKAPETSKVPVPEANSGDNVAVPPKNSGGGGGNKKTLVIVLIVVFVVFVLPGFVLAGSLWWWGRGHNADKLAESIIESSTGGKVDVNSSDGTYSVKSSDGSYEISSSEKLPTNFPDSVPLYDGQDITSSSRTSSDSNSSWTVGATTNDSVAKVESFFKDEFSGWVNEGEFSVNGTTTTSYKKGNFSVVLTVGEDSSDSSMTSITYIVSEDKSQ
jgi:hypothetical protein